MHQSPYSPDLNPIEFMFSYIKYEMKDFQWSHTSIYGILNMILNKISSFLCQQFILHCSRKWNQNEILFIFSFNNRIKSSNN